MAGSRVPHRGAERAAEGVRVERALPGLLIAMLLGALDQTAMAPALPAVAGDLGGLDLMPAVITAYLVAATAVMPLYGRLGDRYGRVPLLHAAIVLFTLGALVCMAAPSMGWLIAGRIVQGMGGGGLMIGAQATLGEIVSPRERGRYLGAIGAAYAVAAVGGPLLGGLIVDALSWRWIFALYPPLGVLAAALVAATLRLPRPAPAAGRPPVDAAGTLALASAVVGLALLGGAPGWGSDLPGWFVPTAAALLVLGAAGWAAASRIAADPVLPPRLFGDRAIAASAAIAFLIGFTLFGTVGFTPAFLQIALEMPAAAAGMLVTALMAGVLVTTVLSGRLITRTGRYRGYPVAGTAVATMGLLLLSRLDAGSSPLLAAALLALLGLGIGLVMQVTVLVAQNSAAHADLGSATAAVTFLRQVGASAGVAVFGALLNLRFAALLPGPVAERAGGAAGLSPESLAALAPGDRAAVAAAFGDALPPLFGWAAPLMALAFLCSLAVPARPLRDTAHAGAAAPEAPGESR
ncbi:MFS transporter [Nocardiopsis composta]|uniref:MFS family permease n=1 Tax=Nocardiopsis composta TaxID=157465 RepID=A0A7W8QLG7_9ACTN|nr:MFS transporter [Nocardiopsis composta]MBB5432485.1 MFS family permease [Nocardiopsis composta]